MRTRVNTPGAYYHPLPPFHSPLSKVEQGDSTQKFPVTVSEMAAGQRQCPGWMEALHQGYFTSQRSLCNKIEDRGSLIADKGCHKYENVLNKQPQRKMFWHLLRKYYLKWISTHGHGLPLFFRKKLHCRGKKH